MGKARAIVIPTALFGALAVAGCSHRKTIGRDQLRSEIRSATSFAAESELFIDYTRQGRATHIYATEHAAYLQAAVEESAKELNRATPEPGTENAAQEYRIQLGLLCHELSGIGRAIGNNDALAAAKKKIQVIRDSLENASSQL